MLQVQRIDPKGAVPDTRGVAAAAGISATGFEVHGLAAAVGVGVQPAGAPGTAGINGDSAVGTKIIVLFGAALIAVVKLTVTVPLVVSTATPDTLFVGTGGAQPFVKAAPLAAFSATASLAPVAKTTPSATLARIV